MGAVWWAGGVINGKAVCAKVGGRDRLFEMKRNVIQELAICLEGRKPDQITVFLGRWNETKSAILQTGTVALGPGLLVSEVVGDDPGNLPTFKFDISGAPHCAWVRDLVADGDVEANPGPTQAPFMQWVLRFLWEATAMYAKASVVLKTVEAEQSRLRVDPLKSFTWDQFQRQSWTKEGGLSVIGERAEPPELPTNRCKDCLKEFFLGTRPKDEVCRLPGDLSPEGCQLCRHPRVHHPEAPETVDKVARIESMMDARIESKMAALKLQMNPRGSQTIVTLESKTELWRKMDGHVAQLNPETPTKIPECAREAFAVEKPTGSDQEKPKERPVQTYMETVLKKLFAESSIVVHDTHSGQPTLDGRFPDLSLVPKESWPHASTTLAVVDVKKPGEFSAADMGQILDYARRLFQGQPLRQRVLTALANDKSLYVLEGTRASDGELTWASWFKPLSAESLTILLSRTNALLTGSLMSWTDLEWSCQPEVDIKSLALVEDLTRSPNSRVWVLSGPEEMFVMKAVSSESLRDHEVAVLDSLRDDGPVSHGDDRVENTFPTVVAVGKVTIVGNGDGDVDVLFAFVMTPRCERPSRNSSRRLMNVDHVGDFVKALERLHSKHWIHRDVAPRNLLIETAMVDGVSHGVLIDFGLCVPPLRDVVYEGTRETASERVLELLSAGRDGFEMTEADDLESLVRSVLLYVLRPIRPDVPNPKEWIKPVRDFWDRLEKDHPSIAQMHQEARAQNYEKVAEMLRGTILVPAPPISSPC
jgi:hypothetical protein